METQWNGKDYAGEISRLFDRMWVRKLVGPMPCSKILNLDNLGGKNTLNGNRAGGGVCSFQEGIVMFSPSRFWVRGRMF